MTRSATGSLKFSSRSFSASPLIAVFSVMLMPGAPAMAQEDVTRDNTTVGDVMLTPLSDLNISKDPIPPVLIRAHGAPYNDVGLVDCMKVRQEIGDLDAVLGEDFDTATRMHDDVSPESVAQDVLSSFIPFRGVIRHLSGANRHAWEFREAIAAGLARRAYLKGLGQGMGCAYPARPLPPGLMVHPEDAAGATASEEGTTGEEVTGRALMVEPVAQVTD